MNILVFSSVYPSPESPKGATSVVKYICEEWIKQGHSVAVITSSTKFPLPFYYLPKKAKQILESRVGFALPNLLNRKEYIRIESGVNIFQLPIKKITPGQIASKRQIEGNFNKVVKYLDSINFIPDIAVGHWLNPQAIYLEKAKQYYNCKTALTLHETPTGKYRDLLNSKLKFIDKLGFRNKYQKKQLEETLNILDKKQYICYSGVTDYYDVLKQEYSIKTKNEITRICYVGSLIQRKYPEKIVEALMHLNSNKKYEVHYVGDGNMREVIEKIDIPQNIRIHFYGRLDRKKTYDVISKCDILTMISKNELFGLVYLEAMLNRTIPIASYNEGFDGVINNMENGFLCNAGNLVELSETFKTIENLTDKEYYDIQKAAYETAQNMTDSKMAEKYLIDIVK